jgi:hypothetical protein
MIGRAVRAIDPAADHDRRLFGVDPGENVMAGVLAPDDNSGHGGLLMKFPASLFLVFSSDNKRNADGIGSCAASARLRDRLRDPPNIGVIVLVA